jgi:hypothetical protein
VDLAGLEIRRETDIDGIVTYTQGSSYELAAGATVRFVEGSPAEPSEISVGTAVGDTMSYGYVAISAGPWDDSSASTLVDYVEYDADSTDSEAPSRPTYVSFDPDPVDLSGVAAGKVIARGSFAADSPSFLRSDWSVVDAP